MLVGGDAGHSLGDSLYETVIYVAGRIAGLGTDAEIQDLTAADVDAVGRLVALHNLGGIEPGNVTKVGSARRLWTFDTAHAGSY